MERSSPNPKDERGRHVNWDGGPAPAGLRALVVDDEPSLVKVISTYLEREGFAVATAGDGEQAIALARESAPT